MRKTRLLLGLTALGLIAGVGIFHACKKDANEYPEVQKHKMMGNYQQPTQVVDINTAIIVGNVEYPVVGSAVVGNYDGLIYECNVQWTMQAEGATEYLTMLLNAALKPEYHDIAIDVEPTMDNYVITVTNSDMITTESLSNLWANIVAECEANTVIVENDEEFYDENGSFLLTLNGYIKFCAEPEEMDFFANHSITDNTQVVASFLSDNSIEDGTTSKLYFKHGRDIPCSLALGLCVILSADIDIIIGNDFNCYVTEYQNKYLIFPIRMLFVTI